MANTTSEPAELADRRNSVELVGRLTTVTVRLDADGVQRATFRLTVVDDGGRRDTIDCETSRRGIVSRLQRVPAETHVRITGAIRRTYWRSSSGLASRTFVEVDSAKRI